MLIKTYSSTGVFPDYGTNGTQLNVERDTGKPTTVPATFRNVNKVMRIRHQLKGKVCFYAVTHLVNDMLIVVSDDTQSRFYWETGGKRFTYLIDAPVSSYEEAWEMLFEELVVDKRPRVVNQYRAMAGFFSEVFDYKNRGKYYISRVKAEYNNEPCMMTLSVSQDTPSGRYEVEFSQFGQKSVSFLACFHTPIFRYIAQALKT